MPSASSSWRRQLADTVRTVGKLRSRIALSNEEERYFTGLGNRSEQKTLPFAVTPYYLSLLGNGPDDPLRRQVIPRVNEHTFHSYETQDPLSEARFQPVSGLVHRYPSRVLVTLTDACAGYCRYCFRRSFSGSGTTLTGLTSLSDIKLYIAEHAEVREVILSGGDPLILDDSSLHETLSGLREAAPQVSFRIHTRVPAVLPMRIDQSLASLLKAFMPVWVVIQTNHPREITDQYIEAAATLTGNGIPLLNHTVLLRGVNDDIDTLEELCIGLSRNSIKPYYLFQGDLALGTSHFRVPLQTGLSLAKDLRNRVSGLEFPTYAVDLPDGGGKVDLLAARVAGPESGFYLITGGDGREYRYPHEE